MYYGYLMEQGTGKSKSFLDKSIHLFKLGKIDAIGVLAPNGVHRNWIEIEVPSHVEGVVPIEVFLWRSDKAGTKWFQEAAEKFLRPKPGVLKILAVNTESFQRKGSKAFTYLCRFMKKNRTHLGVDESSTIKTPSATRSREVRKLGKFATARAIMTGTVVTTGPFNFYSQFEFLKPGALGFTNYTAFKAYYAEWKRVPNPSGKETFNIETRRMDRTIPEIVAYRNLDELKRRVASMSYICRKEDCIDLPPKVPVLRPCEMKDEQAELYKRVRNEVLIFLKEHRTLTIRASLARMMRLSQVAGGFVPSDQENKARAIDGPNAKLESLLGLIEEMGDEDKLIIWSRFVPELELITAVINDNYAGGVSRWWGVIPEATRGIEKDEFQNNPSRRFFVGQQHSGGYGITLTAANQVAYFTNSFSLEARLQSEDRAHRIGQTRSVTYHDIIATGSIDFKILKVLRAQQELAEMFKKVDDVIDWLESPLEAFA